MNIKWDLTECPETTKNTKHSVWTCQFKGFVFEVKGTFTQDNFFDRLYLVERYHCKIYDRDSSRVLYEHMFKDLQTAQANVLTYAVNHLDDEPAAGVHEQLDMDMTVDMAVLYNRAAERAEEQKLFGEALKWRLEADLYTKKAEAASRALARIRQEKR